MAYISNPKKDAQLDFTSIGSEDHLDPLGLGHGDYAWFNWHQFLPMVAQQNATPSEMPNQTLPTLINLNFSTVQKQTSDAVSITTDHAGKNDITTAVATVDCIDYLKCTNVNLDNGIDSYAKSTAASGGGTSGGKVGSVVTDYFSGKSDGTAGYDVQVHFSGSGWTQSLQKAFIDAANYFTSVITADIGGGGIVNGVKVDDLYVSAELSAIDGLGGILGQAGPTNVWKASELTVAGKMQFDSADAGTYLNAGLWDDIVTHEFMHVLGFGSLWNFGSNPLATTSGQYTGTAGLAAYNQLTGGSNAFIPVETDGGAGTANAHWDEAALGSELMTGYINNSNYLSNFSVNSLADLGYAIGYKDYPYDGIFFA